MDKGSWHWSLWGAWKQSTACSLFPSCLALAQASRELHSVTLPICYLALLSQQHRDCQQTPHSKIPTLLTWQGMRDRKNPSGPEGSVQGVHTAS